ncbi:MAG: serine protein kinase, partial [Myxococcales bacterium]|nr:serine protein kinase [Myxococcales bacterium]
MTTGSNLVDRIAALQDRKRYEDLHWTGSFAEYLELVRENPRLARTAYERLYDMILSHGTEEYVDSKKKITRYRFFADEAHGGRDAIFGLDIPLMRLVNVIKAAALRYGTERRIILLHGPVGSSKSTIVRLLKKGLEEYSRTPEGALYTYEWVLPEGLRHLVAGQEAYPSPMNEEPLKLIPPEIREEAITALGLESDGFRPFVRGQLNPACRYIFRELMLHYHGDWSRVVEHIRVRRLLVSEEDRVGVGTFQPKD